MAFRTLSYFGIGAAIALAVVLGIAAPGVGHAGMLKCEDHFLEDIDEMQLRAAAIKVLPRSVHIVVTGACRNPGWAYGFIETKKTTTPEGVRQWYELICRRMAQPWQCEPPEFKQLFVIEASIGGVLHPVELSFGKDTSLELARVLAPRAIDVYAESDSRLPSCGVSEPKESDLLRAKHNHQSLPAGKEVVHVSVADDPKLSVTLDDVDVAIDFKSPGHARGLEAVCWWDVIVVT
jgi:hypothetical protein